MDEPFWITKKERYHLDSLLRELDITDLQRLVQWGPRKGYLFDETSVKTQVFDLIQNAESEKWLSDLILEFHEMYPGKELGADLLNRAGASASASEPDESTSYTTATSQDHRTESRSSVDSSMLLPTELSAMAAEFAAIQWRRHADLADAVEGWEDLLRRTRMALSDWRQTQGRSSPDCDIQRLCVLDAIEVAMGALDEADAALIPLLDPGRLDNVGARVPIARLVIRDLVRAVEEVENLRARASDDALRIGEGGDERPLSFPTKIFNEVGAVSQSASSLSGAFKEAAPFVSAVADYVFQAIQLSEDSLNIIYRLVDAIRICSQRACDKMILATVPEQYTARWNSSARQLAEDTDAVLIELHIYRQVRRRQERRDRVRAGQAPVSWKTSCEASRQLEHSLAAASVGYRDM